MTNTANKKTSVLSSLLIPAALLMLTSVGCATAGSGGSARGRDMHVTATVAGGAARAVVSGPAVLLHVDIDGANDLALYRVAAAADGTDACAAATRGPATELRRGASNRVNLTVASGEIVCVASNAGASNASITWHARRTDSADASINGRLFAANDRD